MQIIAPQTAARKRRRKTKKRQPEHIGPTPLGGADSPRRPPTRRHPEPPTARRPGAGSLPSSVYRPGRENRRGVTVTRPGKGTTQTVADIARQGGIWWGGRLRMDEGDIAAGGPAAISAVIDSFRWSQGQAGQQKGLLARYGDYRGAQRERESARIEARRTDRRVRALLSPGFEITGAADRAMADVDRVQALNAPGFQIAAKTQQVMDDLARIQKEKTGFGPDPVMLAPETTPGGPSLQEIQQYRSLYDPIGQMAHLPVQQPGTGGALDVPIGLADMVTGIPTAIRDPSLANIGFAAASVIPGGKALKVADTAAGVLLKETVGRGALGAPARRFVRGAAATGTRSQRFRDLVQQLPASPSTPTSMFQRGVIDPAQQRLGEVAQRLIESPVRGARPAGKVLTQFSSRGRTVKHAGRIDRTELGRTRAEYADEINLVRGVRKRGERSAHFWWAQLPERLHNTKGLQKVRDRLARELDELDSGRREKKLEQLRATIEKSDPSDAGRVRAERIGMEMEDIEQQSRDLRRKLVVLDGNIKSGIKPDKRVIEAVQTLSGERERILGEAGMLGEDAGDRTNRLYHWLQLGEGEELVEGGYKLPAAQEGVEAVPVKLESEEGIPFVGHRETKVRGARESLASGGPITRHPRPPQGVGKRNNLVLVDKGRVRDDIRVVLEDWQAAQHYEFGKTAVDTMTKAGEKVRGGVVKPRHVLVNPNAQARKIPRQYRVDWDSQLREQGFDPQHIDEIADNLQGLSDTFVTDKNEIEALIEEAKQGGYYDQLRQVPEDLVKRYFGQIVPPGRASRLSSSMPMLGKGMDTINNILYTSMLYSNPGYIPANLMGNAAFAALHQGPLMIRNLALAGQFLAKSREGLRTKVLNEVAQGPTVSLASGGVDRFNAAIRTGSRKLGHISDTGPRVAAFFHEAARAGILSKEARLTGKLTKADYEALDDLFTNKEMRPKLNDIRERANQAMVSFDRMSPWEASFAKRALFVWPWIRGATAYPGRFAMDYPGRTAAMAYVASGQPLPDRLKPLEDVRDKALDARMENMPSYLQQAVKVGEKTVKGEQFPSIFNLGPVSPVGTALESAQSIIGAPGSRTPWEFLSPALRYGAQVLQGESPFGTKVSRGEAIKQGAARLFPTVKLGGELIHPPKTLEEAGMYPEDVTWQGRLKRAARVGPYAVNPEETYKSAARQGLVGGPGQAAWHKAMKERTQFWQAAKKMGADLEGGRLPKELRTAFNRKGEKAARYAIAESKSSERLTQREKIAIDIDLLEKWGYADKEGAAQARKWAKTASEEDIQTLRNRWSQRDDGPFHQAYLDPINTARKRLGL